MRVYAIVLALLATACSGGPPSAASGGLERSTSLVRLPVRVHPDRSPSSFLPDAKKAGAVLFVSDAGTSDVYIYTLPSLKLAAKVTGFTQPQGECADNKGNVWVADTNAGTIYKLSHYGRLKATLTESDVYPAGCAWDATTGNLAVTNLLSSSGAAGNVAIYKNGSSTPTTYANPDQVYYFFAGYDRKGNLFFDGLDTKSNFILSELPSKGSSPYTISITGGQIDFPGMVQWTGSQLNVGDQGCGGENASCVYALSLSGKSARIGATTTLENSAHLPVCDVVQAVIENQQLYGSDYDFCGSAASGTYVWPYPAGGAPSTFNDKTDVAPVGAAVSK